MKFWPLFSEESTYRWDHASIVPIMAYQQRLVRVAHSSTKTIHARVLDSSSWCFIFDIHAVSCCLSIVIPWVAANLSPLLFLDLFHDHALTSTAARVCSRSSKASLQVLCRVLQTYGLCRVHERPVMLGLGVPYITERVAKLFSLIKQWCLQEEATIMRLI